MINIQANIYNFKQFWLKINIKIRKMELRFDPQFHLSI